MGEEVDMGGLICVNLVLCEHYGESLRKYQIVRFASSSLLNLTSNLHSNTDLSSEKNTHLNLLRSKCVLSIIPFGCS